jgi:CMP-N-acetylneuraminic acid synthetase
MKFTGYVTVRLNSQRLPGKSIMKLNDTPLVERAIRTLNQVEDIDETVLYCTDNKIENYISKDLAYKRLDRPSFTNSDTSSFNEVLSSAISRIDTDYIVFLCCTSPFVRPETISEMIKKIKTGSYDSAFSAKEDRTFCWFNGAPLNYTLMGDIPRTQDLMPVMIETSGLYIFSKDLFQSHSRRIGFNPYVKSLGIIESWDIDTPEDFVIAKAFSEIKDDIFG